MFGIVASCTVLNSSLSPWLPLTDLAMVYLLGVVIAATYLPWHASVTSAVLSLFCFDFFFVPSVFTFQFADKQNLLTGLILLAVGVITSALASERCRQTKAAAEAAMLAREEQLRSSLLASISHGLRTSLAVRARCSRTAIDRRGNSGLKGWGSRSAVQSHNFTGWIYLPTIPEGGARFAVSIRHIRASGSAQDDT